MAASSMRSGGNIIKSPRDTKNYRLILLDNGLRALLISDLESHIDDPLGAAGNSIPAPIGTTQPALTSSGSTKNNHINPDQGLDLMDTEEAVAAASLCLDVGSFADPDDLPGLAHFVEHMVFMGSEKYPDEDAFQHFLSKHDGSSNGETRSDRTKFWFAVIQSHFPKALDIFAQFFISPLMKMECVDKEVKVIENEFRETMNADSIREDHLLASMAAPDHPAGKFRSGNEYTLKTQAMEKGIDIYKICKEFHRRYYSAQYMTLAVQAKATLDDIEILVKRVFSAIPNNGLPQPSTRDFGDAFDTKEFRRLYKVIPVEDNNKLQITWSLPTTLEDYRVKPELYVMDLTDGVGAGSISSYLRKKLWAQELTCFHKKGYMYSLFIVQVLLTDTGLSNINEILTVVFEYVEMLRVLGPQVTIYNDIGSVYKNRFDWYPQLSPIGCVNDLSEALHCFAPEHVLNGSTLMSSYQPKVISNFLQLLTYERCNVMVLSKSFDRPEVFDLREEFWCHTKYCVTDFDCNWSSKWKQLNPRSELHLPLHNPFFARDFTVKQISSEKLGEPMVIRKNQRLRFWYCHDDKFRKPRGCIYISLMSPVISATARSRAIFDLFCELLESNVKEVVLQARAADLNCVRCAEQTGLTIIFDGLSDKLPQLFKTIVDYLVEFTVIDEWFDVAKQRLKTKYYNSTLNLKNLAGILLGHLIVCSQWPAPSKRSALITVKKQEVQAFVKEFFQTLKIEGLVYGNFYPQEVNDMAIYVENKFNKFFLSSTTLPKERVVQLPKGKKYCRVSNFQAGDTNSYILNYYQAGPCNVRQQLLAELLARVTNDHLFSEMRTQQQLCYHVFCSSTITHGILGVIIGVKFQATKNSASYVDAIIDDFLMKFESRLAKWKIKDFQPYFHSMIASKELSGGDMDHEASLIWSEIVDRTYLFDRPFLQIEEAMTLTLTELQALNRTLFSKSKRRQLSVQVVGSGYSERSQRVPTNRFLDRYPDSNRSQATTSAAEPWAPTGPDVSDVLSSANASKDEANGCEFEYLQDEQSNHLKDPHCIDDPVAFKNSLVLYPVSKVLMT